ncbi:MAG: ABC transporter permease [Acidimicrobiia bacterium]|nr:ABC transporter permease [Acidimicrobiia bacterium]NNC42397.1 ABC transporter permease [Acidimicrobiia bacterium]NNL47941.1 ABC transporter permease [Acidimicrobiia bacterium]
MIKRAGYTLLAPLAAVVFALVISSIVLILSGASPLDAYGNIWEFGTRLETILEAINRGSALYVSGIAVAIGFRMNLFNIGVEGQYILAAFFAAYVGGLIGPTNPVLHVGIIVITAMAVGAFWSGLAGVLKVTRNVHEVISTIMLNNIAVSGIVSFLLARWTAQSAQLDTALAQIPESGWLPSLNPVVELFTRDIRRVDLYSYVLIAIAVGIGYHVIINKTRVGFDLRATGINPFAAEASGVNPKRTVVIAMLLSGAVAGLVGLGDLLGDAHTYNLRFFQGLGFAGIAVALLGRNSAVGIAFAAFVIGWLERSSGVLEVRGDAPREIVTIMIGVIILAAVIAYAVVERVRLANEAQAAALATAEIDPDLASEGAS